MIKAVEILSDIRSSYNCFDANEAPKYHALALAIEALKAQLSGEGTTSDTTFGEWIPCSERLPEKDGRYWISTKTIVCEDNFENGEFVFYRSNVLAWMPLPLPYTYKGEEE